MNSVVILTAVACLAHCVLATNVPVYPVAIHGAVYQGAHYGATAHHRVHDASAAETHHGAPAGIYSGPIANPVVLPNGFIADTPEVVAIRGAHLTALANARAAVAARGGHNGQWASDGSYARPGHNAGGRYVGPIATPVVLANGFLADTPEVAAAKAAHLSSLAAHVPYAAGHAYHPGYAAHAYHHG